MTTERDVQQVLARYVRATDARDGAALAELFVADGRVEMFHNQNGKPVPIGELVGAPAIARATAELMKPHPPGGWSHHTTHDPLIEIEGDARGAQGTVTPIESGYYRAELRKVDGRWRLATHRIYLDLPMAMPRS